MECHEPLIIAGLLTIIKRRNLSVPWVIKRSNLGRRFLDRLEDLFRSEIKRGKCTDLEFKLQEEGIFCGNLLASWGPYIPFHMAWCWVCYMCHTRDNFPAKGKVEDSRNIIVENKRKHHLVISGNHLITHFQCDVRNFRNMQVRDPVSHIRDGNRMIWSIQHATLDAFFSSKPRTVKYILMTLKIIQEVGDAVLGLL